MDITDEYEVKITIHLSNTAHSDPSKYVSPEQNYPFGVRSPTLLPYIGYFHNNLRNGNSPVLWGINPDEHPPKSWDLDISPLFVLGSNVTYPFGVRS